MDTKFKSLQIQRDGLVEENHALELEESSLRDPQRIDGLARQMGLQSPQAGQVIRMDSAEFRFGNAGDGEHGAGCGHFGEIGYEGPGRVSAEVFWRRA